MNSKGYLGYRLLSAALMLICLFLGVALLRGFLGNTMMPSAGAPGGPLPPTDYWGYYMMGFAGALMVTWAAFLFSAVRTPSLARSIGTATAFGLVLNALFRIAAWFSGEYAEAGNVPRVEAAIMLLLAVGFIWLRPPKVMPAARQ